MKLAITVFAFVLAFDFSAIAQRRPAPQNSKPASTKTSTKPAGNFTVTQLDAAKLTALLASPKAGKKPLLINFWATWCAPCREEFPDLLSVNEKFKSRGLNFITISTDETDLINTEVPKVLRELKATALPAYLFPPDESEQLIQMIDKTWSGQLPATFLYDAEGKLVFSHKGRVKADELEAAVKAAIGDK